MEIMALQASRENTELFMSGKREVEVEYKEEKQEGEGGGGGGERYTKEASMCITAPLEREAVRISCNSSASTSLSSPARRENMLLS